VYNFANGENVWWRKCLGELLMTGIFFLIIEKIMKKSQNIICHMGVDCLVTRSCIILKIRERGKTTGKRYINFNI